MLKIAKSKQAKSSFCVAFCKRTEDRRKGLKKECSSLLSILSVSVWTKIFWYVVLEIMKTQNAHLAVEKERKKERKKETRWHTSRARLRNAMRSITSFRSFDFEQWNLNWQIDITIIISKRTLSLCMYIFSQTSFD